MVSIHRNIPLGKESIDKPRGMFRFHSNLKTRKPYRNPWRILIEASRFLRDCGIDVCFSHNYWPSPAVGVLAACLINRILRSANDSHALSARTNAFGHFAKKSHCWAFMARWWGPSQVQYYSGSR